MEEERVYNAVEAEARVFLYYNTLCNSVHVHVLTPFDFCPFAWYSVSQCNAKSLNGEAPMLHIAAVSILLLGRQAKYT